MAGISNIFIDGILRKKLNVDTFGGVYSANRIPKRLLSKDTLASGEHISIVVNLSRENEVGTHFITLKVTNKRIVIIDSLALPIQNVVPHLFALLKMARKAITFQYAKPIQSPDSAMCGFYCIYFCLQQDMREKVSKNLNDATVLKHIKKLVNKR